MLSGCPLSGMMGREWVLLQQHGPNVDGSRRQFAPQFTGNSQNLLDQPARFAKHHRTRPPLTEDDLLDFALWLGRDVDVISVAGS